MKVLFFGTPAIAVPFLQWLIEHHAVVGVVCRPDEPVGRGYSLTWPPTKTLAASASLPIFQPQGPWTKETTEAFHALNADVGVIVAYGRILPEAVFMSPRLGSINIHFSMLPAYRGAAPIQWALINGEAATGVTSFWLEAGLDSGPVFHQLPQPIAPDDTVVTLREKLVSLGLAVLDRTMKDLSNGIVRRQVQVGAGPLAPPLKKEMGRIDWTKPASSIVNLVRGVVDWPGAVTRYMSAGSTPKNLKIFKAAVGLNVSGAPGRIIGVEKNKGIYVQAGDGAVLLLDVQPEGKKGMPAWAFWQGAHLSVGDTLG